MINEERLIVALDLPDYDSVVKYVETLGDSVHFYKVGLELLMSGRYFDILNHLKSLEKKVFADIKFFDIPETVGRSVKNLVEQHQPEFITVHSGSPSVLAAAANNKKDSKILAVTVLTSITRSDQYFAGFNSDWQLLDEVIHRAEMALKSGCDGVVASPLEASMIKRAFGDELLIVCPGIRNVSVEDIQDQKRVATVDNTLKAGADYIVVGRPIRDSKSPKVTAEYFQLQIKNCFQDFLT